MRRLIHFNERMKPLNAPGAMDVSWLSYKDKVRSGFEASSKLNAPAPIDAILLFQKSTNFSCVKDLTWSGIRVRLLLCKYKYETELASGVLTKASRASLAVVSVALTLKQSITTVPGYKKASMQLQGAMAERYTYHILYSFAATSTITCSDLFIISVQFVYSFIRSVGCYLLSAACCFNRVVLF